MKEKITKFEDMTVWQESQELAVLVYHVTKKFPGDEQYALTSQLRRAASSVSANIAEGFGRATSKDRSHFYHIALGSLLETKNFIYLSARLEYITKDEVVATIKGIDSVHRQITAILGFFKRYA
ncbi:four helix bundle protein [soil metagenome]